MAREAFSLDDDASGLGDVEVLLGKSIVSTDKSHLALRLNLKALNSYNIFNKMW